MTNNKRLNNVTFTLFSILLFLIMQKVLSTEIRPVCPEELLYAHDLVLVSDSLESLKERLEAKKRVLDSKGFSINADW